MIFNQTNLNKKVDGRIRARLSDAHGAEYSHSFGDELMPRVNDKRYHVVRMSVFERNSTLSVDGIESTRQLISSSSSSSGAFQRQKQMTQSDYGYNKFEHRFQSDQSVVVIEVGGLFNANTNSNDYRSSPIDDTNNNNNINNGDDASSAPSIAENSGAEEVETNEDDEENMAFDGNIYGLVYNHYRCAIFFFLFSSVVVENICLLTSIDEIEFWTCYCDATRGSRNSAA